METRPNHIESELNIAIIGDTNSGKTSLVRRYAFQNFDENKSNGIIANKTCIFNEEKIHLKIFDSFKPHMRLNGFHAYILTLDLSNKAALKSDSLEQIIYSLSQINEDSILFIAGTKADLTDDINVDPALIAEITKNKRIIYKEFFATSALENRNIDNLMYALCISWLEKKNAAAIGKSKMIIDLTESNINEDKKQENFLNNLKQEEKNLLEISKNHDKIQKEVNIIKKKSTVTKSVKKSANNSSTLFSSQNSPVKVIRNNQNNETKKQLEEANKKLEEMQRELAAAKKELQQSRIDLAQADTELKNKNIKLENSKNKRKQLKKELAFSQSIIEKIDNELIDGIGTLDRMTDPVTHKSGRTYDKPSLVYCQNKDPIDGSPLTESDLFPSVALKNIIGHLQFKPPAANLAADENEKKIIEIKDEEMVQYKRF